MLMRFTGEALGWAVSLADRGDPALKNLPALIEAIVKRFSPPGVLALLDDSLNLQDS